MPLLFGVFHKKVSVVFTFVFFCWCSNWLVHRTYPFKSSVDGFLLLPQVQNGAVNVRGVEAINKRLDQAASV
jgi:hypothetical protein